MKFTPIFALLAACAPVVAHAQTADAPDNTPAVAAPMIPLPLAPKSAATADAFVWRFAPPVGSRWTVRSFTRATSVANAPLFDGGKPQPVNVNVIEKMTADYDVLSRDALGATTIRMTLREMTLSSTMASANKTVTAPAHETVDPKAVNGATLTIKQSSDGRVWGVVGMRAFQRKIFEASGVGDAATITQMLDANPMTNNSDMMKSLSMVSGTLPTSPVRVSESWSYATTLPAPLALEITGTRTLKKLDEQFAVVADSATYVGGKAHMSLPNTAQTPDVDINYGNLSGSVTGTSRIERSSGLPLEMTLNQTIKGSVSSQVPATNGKPAQKIDVPIDVTTSTRMVMEPR